MPILGALRYFKARLCCLATPPHAGIVKSWPVVSMHNVRELTNVRRAHERLRFSLICFTRRASANLGAEACKSACTKPLSGIDRARSQQWRRSPHQF
ncbi:uncharacterized protein LACBIDRAFT_316181 [Laccaria bicolor S238N-H82]|uniref:Predicted protein n=1 Tax=Laccaria bicolor (strain S238N-H82 / ATCC MYA-4686) TaxID=486041 RepID=B0E0D1_LACBS|nr:uncharacterized protein LACBIDRAFT_316181 [Laccaria bicolor S238N-H82]EDQ99663.1 predicted protein [Laccaria bicolor S238N-H82]|eukprot:XP_001889640.1 predicted protein [Laccaria bicolor S238N-H82]